MSADDQKRTLGVALERLPPFVLSLSKDAGCASSHACFDKLSTNGSSPPDQLWTHKRISIEADTRHRVSLL